MTLDELRAGLVRDVEAHGDKARFHQGMLAMAEAALAAHDAAVEAAKNELHAPLSPANLGPANARAPRRNIADEVYARLNGTPQSIEALADAIGGTRPAQVSAAILKLGDKAVSEDGGYVRRDTP